MDITKFKVKEIYKEDKNYPKPLLDLLDPPKKLYYIGVLHNIDWNSALAIVGSRHMTQYGRQVLERFVPDLVSKRVVIVSGFMYGVDTQAHSLTIEMGGQTVAVLANGLDVCYPPENQNLYEKVLKNKGLLISEYPMGRKPHLWTYPRRNRIVAALSLLGTLVVEAGENSGSLITAKLANKLKRKVYAVPGPITSNVSFGTNKLIKNRQAKICLDTAQIVESEQLINLQTTKPELNGLEAKIYQILLRENLTLDEICLALESDISQTSTTLSLMTLSGLVEEIAGKYYCTSK